MSQKSVADPRGRQGGTPPGVQVLSFSCSFRPKICKIIPIWELTHPPLENPGSATEEFQILVGFVFVMVTPTDITS